jgi:peptidoglycan/LPS O-acetylase OafA/YrhL
VVWNAVVPGTGPLSKVLPAMLPFFALGMLAALWGRGRTLSPLAVQRLLAVAFLGVVGNVALQVVAPQVSPAAHNLPAGVGFAALIAAAAGSDGLRALRWRPLAGLGTISYGVYLWHVPVLWWLRGQGLLPLDPVLALPVLLVPTVLMAFASWRFVERPVMDWARSRPARETAPRRAAGPRFPRG